MRSLLWFVLIVCCAAARPLSAEEAPSRTIPAGEVSRDQGDREAPETARRVSLNQLVQEALDRAPGLQAKRRAYEAARARVLPAWLPDDPMVGVDVEGQPDLFNVSERTNNEYMLSQTIPFPTTLWLRGVRAAREADMAYQAYQEERRQIVWHVEEPYAQLLLATHTVAALRDVRGLLEQVTKVVESRYASNQAAQSDLLKAQIEAAKLDIEAVAWAERAHIAQAHLSHLLNESLETRYLPEPESPRAVVRSTDALARLAIGQRPELKMLEQAIAKSKAERAMARTSWLPEIAGRLEARQFRGENGVREYDTFIGVTVPVWSLLKGAGGEWRAAQRGVQEAEAAYLEMKNEVLLAVHEAASKITRSHYAVETYEQAILPKAKQQAEVALSAYQAGRTDVLSLIDAQRMLRDAQIAYFEQMADYEIGLADVRVAVGTDDVLEASK